MKVFPLRSMREIIGAYRRVLAQNVGKGVFGVLAVCLVGGVDVTSSAPFAAIVAIEGAAFPATKGRGSKAR